MKIAVVGSGISGLGCARALASKFDVTLYEASERPGGHTNTVEARVDGVSFPVDTGFLVFNERTYPRLLALFAELRVPVAASDMSFGVSVAMPGGRRLEWAGTNLSTVFAQRRNLGSPRFVGMLAELMRFNRQASRVARGEEPAEGLSLGEFLDRNRYGAALRDWYLLPMAAAIWSCPSATMMGYPFATFARFCANHGLLQIVDRPQWYTVRGGARCYVDRIVEQLPDVRLGEPVHAIERLATAGVRVHSRSGSRQFDHVVLACHSDQAARLLPAAGFDEQRRIVEAVSYQPNRALLHTDVALMPRMRRVWSSWNYLADAGAQPSRLAVSVTYLLNRLQPLPVSTPLLLSLNPQRQPRDETVLAEIAYEHPVFDARAIDAQRRLAGAQGRGGVWFAGAWTGYGFHEDGLASGIAVAEAIRGTRRQLGTSPEGLAA